MTLNHSTKKGTSSSSLHIMRPPRSKRRMFLSRSFVVPSCHPVVVMMGLVC